MWINIGTNIGRAIFSKTGLGALGLGSYTYKTWREGNEAALVRENNRVDQEARRELDRYVAETTRITEVNKAEALRVSGKEELNFRREQFEWDKFKYLLEREDRLNASSKTQIPNENPVVSDSPSAGSSSVDYLFNASPFEELSSFLDLTNHTLVHNMCINVSCILLIALCSSLCLGLNFYLQSLGEKDSDKLSDQTKRVFSYYKTYLMFMNTQLILWAILSQFACILFVVFMFFTPPQPFTLP